MIRRPPRSTPLYSSAASDVYKRQIRDRRADGGNSDGYRRAIVVPAVARNKIKLITSSYRCLRCVGLGNHALADDDTGLVDWTVGG